ncbi:MAG: ABC transporter ATP-binding protein, partial [Lysobacteraceae bacterium]
MTSPPAVPPAAAPLSSNLATGTTDKPKPRLGSLRALWPFVRVHGGLFALWLVALAVASAATLSLPVAFRQMIDDGFSSGSNVDRAFLFLFVVAVVLALASAARFYFVSLLGERVVADLRKQLYGHLIGLGADFHDRTRSGELVSRLSADSELLRNVVGTSMSVALRSTVTVIGSLTMLFITSPRLAAFALIGIPLAVLPIILGSRRLEKASRASQDRVADANTLASETLGAVRTVQAHAREPYEQGRFGDAVAVAVETARRRIRAQAWVTAAAITLVFGAIVLVLWSGAHDVIGGRMTAGTLAQFVLYALVGGGSVGALAEVWNDLQRASGGMGRIAELLQETSEINAPLDAKRLLTPLHGDIRFDNVVFRYPARPDLPALDGFDLEIRPGETV